MVEIYPREGTETRFPMIRAVCVKLKFIPVRGRKPAPLLHRSQSIEVEIYPREGTETRRYSLFAFRKVMVEIYPREGTETWYT